MRRCYQDCIIFVQSEMQSNLMNMLTGSVAGAYSWLDFTWHRKSKKEEEGKREGKKQIEKGRERKREIDRHQPTV